MKVLEKKCIALIIFILISLNLAACQSENTMNNSENAYEEQKSVDNANEEDVTIISEENTEPKDEENDRNQPSSEQTATDIDGVQINEADVAVSQGLGETESIEKNATSISESDIISEIEVEIPIIIYSAGSGCYILDRTEGLLFGVGSNESNQLGINDEDGLREEGQYIEYPVRIPVPTRVQSVRTNSERSYAIDVEGFVYTWGYDVVNNSDGHERVHDLLPRKVEELKNIEDISVGANFSLAVDNDGFLWSRGTNNSGQLGIGNYENHSDWVKLTDISKIKSIYASIYSAYAIDEDGALYAWGYIGQKYSDIKDMVYDGKPVFISEVSNVEKIVVSGGESIFIIDGYGKGYVWGDNMLGQLGTGDMDNRFIPVEFVEVDEITDAIIEQTGGSLLTESGLVFCWGRNNFGQLGNGSEVANYRPVQVQGLENIQKIYSGFRTRFALDKDGKLWWWGNLFSTNDENVLTPQLFEGLPRVNECFISFSARYLLDDSKQLWGFGSHGIKTYEEFNNSVPWLLEY